MLSSERQLVTLKGGYVVDWTVAGRLLDIEARGGRFELLADGRFRVVPSSVLTAEDVAFLREHRDEARRVVAYDADEARDRCEKWRTETWRQKLIATSARQPRNGQWLSDWAVRLAIR